jgi:hypothetical protein
VPFDGGEGSQEDAGDASSALVVEDAGASNDGAQAAPVAMADGDATDALTPEAAGDTGDADAN